MPRQLVYNAVCRYLKPNEIEALDKDLSKVDFIKSDKKYCNCLFKHFDINKFKDSPVYKEDILLYNYFMYDYNGKKIIYKGLISKYIEFITSLEKK